MEHSSETMLSIAVVTYNHGHTVKKCISSIAQQTYSKIDFVIVDDFSCDFDREEIEQYIHSLNAASICNFSVDAFSEHKGIAAAYNRALQLAKGEYVLFMGGDDCLAGKDVLERFVNELGADSSVDIFQGRAVLAPSGEQLPSTRCMECVQAGNALELLKETEQQPFSQLLCIQSAFFRTEWIRNIGGFANHYQFAIDWPLYIKALLNTAVFHCSDLVVTKMRDGGAFRSFDIGRMPFQKGYVNEAARAIREYAIEGQRGVRPKGELSQFQRVAKVYAFSTVSFSWPYYSLTDRFIWKIKNKKYYWANGLLNPEWKHHTKKLIKGLIFGAVMGFMLLSLIAKLTVSLEYPALDPVIPIYIAIFALLCGNLCI